MQALIIDPADRIRVGLAERKLSQAELAAAIGMDVTALSKSMRGRRRFTTSELSRVARELHASLDYLAGNDVGTGVTKPPESAELSAQLYSGEHGTTRRRIVDAAWTLIAQRGFHAVRVRDVAERCAISTAAVHYHFHDRLQLLEDALRVSVGQAYDRQVAGLESISDPTERLLHLIDLQLPGVGLLRDEWSIWLQVWSESVLDANIRALHRAAYSRWRDTVRGVIEYGQQQGVFVTENAVAVARGLTALVDGLGIQVLAGGTDYAVEDMRTTLHEYVRSAICTTSH